MQRECIKNIYLDFFSSYEKEKHDIFIKEQAIKHSCTEKEIESLLEAYGSYQFREMMSGSGASMSYDDYTAMCLEIIGEIKNKKPIKIWWQFWK